ncbi:hypothetical protein ACOI1C_20305 [Bacillus sp. DJP31]|uniref:hypothetical protein n=1 Tax=Bacillus sp. DJP31 TaxID=3409789 RepID=UPI003BB75EEC
MSNEQKRPKGATPIGSMGTTGDVLITMSGSSSTELAWTGGHAAIVVDRFNSKRKF